MNRDGHLLLFVGLGIQSTSAIVPNLQRENWGFSLPSAALSLKMSDCLLILRLDFSQFFLGARCQIHQEVWVIRFPLEIKDKSFSPMILNGVNKAHHTILWSAKKSRNLKSTSGEGSKTRTGPKLKNSTNSSFKIYLQILNLIREVNEKFLFTQQYFLMLQVWEEMGKLEC